MYELIYLDIDAIQSGQNICISLTFLHQILSHSQDRCEHLTEQINLAADEKINEILESKDKLLKEAATLTKTGDINALALKISLNEARVVAKKAMNSDVGVKDADKVSCASLLLRRFMWRIYH